MKRKMILGLTLAICLAVFSVSIVALADVDGEVPPILQGDSPGVHQCPRDNYDENTGPTNREGFGDDF